jgi:hypothetical protein
MNKEEWNDGMVELWKDRIMEYWNYGILEEGKNPIETRPTGLSGLIFLEHKQQISC